MIAKSCVEIDGKTYKPGERLPKVSKGDEAWLLSSGYAIAEPRQTPEVKEKPKTKQKEKADDVKRGDK